MNIVDLFGPIISIPFWIDQNIWFPIENKQDLRSNFNFKKEDYLVGSFQRDTEGNDMISPKLIKGPDIFLDIVEKMYDTNKNLKVILSGKRRNYLINNFQNKNIPYKYFEMVSLETLNKLYNILDLYIVSSRIEGGPQAILECSISKTPIVSTDVGVASEILHPNSIYDMNTFHQAQPEINYAHEKAKDFIIPNIMKSFNDLLESIHEG